MSARDSLRPAKKEPRQALRLTGLSMLLPVIRTIETEPIPEPFSPGSAPEARIGGPEARRQNPKPSRWFLRHGEKAAAQDREL